MRPSECRADLLDQLSQTPFADRLELATLTGWSQSAVYAQIERLSEQGLVESIQHTTTLILATRRYCLTAAGVWRLSQDRGEHVRRLLLTAPVSEQSRRLILQRIDTAATLYRLATTLTEIAYPLRLRWYRAQPVDAVVELADGRGIGLVRIGGTADRTAIAKRLRRLGDAIGVGAALIILPDEVRLRHARRVVHGSATMSFLAVERDAITVDIDAAIWRAASGNARFTLAEALSYAIPSSEQIIERPLTRVSMPHSLIDTGAIPLSVSGQRALDLIGDWPWLRREHLADLLDCGQRRVGQLLSELAHCDLVVAERIAGTPRLALSDAGVSYIARRDRTAVGAAKRRWSVEPQAADVPFNWRNVGGARSRQLLRHLAHTESVHRFIAQASRQAAGSDIAVQQLDPPHRASRYFRYEGAVRSIHPDAYFELLSPNGRQAFFLEYERRADRPSMMRDRLAPYLRYYSTRRPLEDQGVIPTVLVVFEDELSVDQFLRLARRESHRAGIDLPLMVSCRDDLERVGPLGTAWRSPGTRSTMSPLSAS